MSQFVNLNTILGNGKSYQVPIYQRDYSWGSDDWEDLWNDIEDIPTDKTHYLGYIVLQQMNGDDNAFWVIDGQQRLTTLSILALAVTDLLRQWADQGIEPAENQLRKEKITERYLGNFSLSSLHISPKIKLNRNNDDYYRSWLLTLRQPPALSKLKPTQRLLQKAFNFFSAQLNQKFLENQSGAALADFLERTVGAGILFTQIVVSNDLDAFKVFETLNARGVKLSTADLLKNYLFKLTHTLGDLDLEEAERRWQHISNTLQSNDITTFIRHYWNSCYRIERQPTLFKAIKREINQAEQAFLFLDTLEKASVYYTAFHSPADELWQKDESVQLKVLKLLKVSTCLPLMLSALTYLPRADFRKLLKELVVITLRYNLSELNPNEAERVFSRVANEVAAGKLLNLRDVVIACKSIYVPDDNFEQNFSTIIINTRHRKELVKYLLTQIENHISGTDYHHEDAVATIEHILPENPGGVWEEGFEEKIQEDFMYRFGNYTLLEANLNHKLGNEVSFQEKREKYKHSKYKLSNEYCNYEKFTAIELSLRQSKLSRIAKGIWKSAYI